MHSDFPSPHSIWAILPEYGEQGNGAALATADSQFIRLPQTPNAVIARLARQLEIDLNALQKRMAETFHRSHQSALPLTRELVLFPVKVRKPRIKGDNTFGYINVHAVRAIRRGADRTCPTLLELKDGRIIPVLWQKSTVEQYYSFAKLAINAAPSRQAAGNTIEQLMELFAQCLLRQAQELPRSG